MTRLVIDFAPVGRSCLVGWIARLIELANPARFAYRLGRESIGTVCNRVARRRDVLSRSGRGVARAQ